MRVRIIFQGLTLFTFDKPTDGAKAGDNLGTLTAWLVSDPKHEHMPTHRHVPRLGFIGRDLGAIAGPGRVENQLDIPKRLELALSDPDAPIGVTVDQSFLDYVPRCGDIHWAQPTEIREEMITSRIVIPSGTIRSRELIKWDWHGTTPTKVAYLDSTVQGFQASEVVVDIGDDADVDDNDHNKYFTIDSSDGALQEKLWPYAKDTTGEANIEPNMVEVLVTNRAARSWRPVFWGIHMQALFDAAGFPRRSAYANVDQFEALARAATQYDEYQWSADVEMMGIGQPFPFLIDIDPTRDKPEALRKAASPYILKGAPPAPSGRQHLEGVPAGAAACAHDPVNVTICPFGRL